MRGSWSVIGHRNQLLLSASTQDYLTLTILYRLNSIGRSNGGGRSWEPGQLFVDHCLCCGHRKLTRHNQDRVVWSIVLAPKELQLRGFDSFDIAASTDGVASVAVPAVGTSGHALRQDLRRIVFANLQLVAYDLKLFV